MARRILVFPYRDWTWAAIVESQYLNPCIAREAPWNVFNKITLSEKKRQQKRAPVFFFLLFGDGGVLRVVASVVSDSATPQTVAHQAPLSVGFSRQDYWSGLPCPPAGDLPDPGIEPLSLSAPALAGEFFTTSAT